MRATSGSPADVTSGQGGAPDAQRHDDILFLRAHVELFDRSPDPFTEVLHLDEAGSRRDDDELVPAASGRAHRRCEWCS